MSLQERPPLPGPAGQPQDRKFDQVIKPPGAEDFNAQRAGDPRDEQTVRTVGLGHTVLGARYPAAPDTLPEQAEPPHRGIGRRGFLTAAGIMTLLAGAGVGYAATRRNSDSTDEATSPGFAEPSPSPADEDAFLRFPHNPRAQIEPRGAVDTSREYEADEVAYTFEWNGTKIPLPKLKDTVEGDADSVRDAFNRATTVLCAMLTALVDPNSRKQFEEMTTIYAADPVAMQQYLGSLRNVFANLFGTDGFNDIAIMIFDASSNPLSVRVATQTNKEGQQYPGIRVVGGDLYIRGIKQNPAVRTDWQPNAGVAPGDAATLHRFMIAVTDGQIRGLELQISANGGKDLLNSEARMHTYAS